MKKLAMLVLIIAVVGFASISFAKAQDPNTPRERPTMVGKVVVEKDADGVITAVQMENKRFGTCNIVLDAKGNELGKNMEGKMVGVKAVESEKDGQKWLTVESYREIQRNKGKDGNNGDRKKGTRGKGDKKNAREKDCDKGTNEKGCKNKK